MSDFTEIKRAIRIVLRRWWVVVLITMLAAVGGYLFSRSQPKVYKATTTMLIGQFIQAVELNRDDILAAELLVRTYADLARREPVLNGAVEALDLDVSWSNLKRRVRVEIIEATQLIEISVEADSPEEATQIADEIASQLIELSPSNSQEGAQESEQFDQQRLASLRARILEGQVRYEQLQMDIDEETSPERQNELRSELNTLEQLITEWERNYTELSTLVESSSTPNYLAVLEPAQASRSPIRPRVTLNTAVMGAVGFMLAIGLVFLLENFDERLRAPDDIEATLGLGYLGRIPKIGGKEYSEKLISEMHLLSPVAEAYRIIWNNIEFLSRGKGIRTLLVTSPGIGQGKSMTAANLAIAVAESGMSVILVDADMRSPVQHGIFNKPNNRGLAQMLNNPEEDPTKYLIETGIDNLRLLPAGRMLTGPGELLRPRRVADWVEKMTNIASLVIMDSPPAAIIADGVVLSSQVDGVLLVVDPGRTTLSSAQKAISNLKMAGAELLGIALNRFESADKSYYPGRISLPKFLARQILPKKDRKAQPSLSAKTKPREKAGAAEKILGKEAPDGLISSDALAVDQVGGEAPRVETLPEEMEAAAMVSEDSAKDGLSTREPLIEETGAALAAEGTNGIAEAGQTAKQEDGKWSGAASPEKAAAAQDDAGNGDALETPPKRWRRRPAARKPRASNTEARESEEVQKAEPRQPTARAPKNGEGNGKVLAMQAEDVDHQAKTVPFRKPKRRRRRPNS